MTSSSNMHTIRENEVGEAQHVGERKNVNKNVGRKI
jgi:hypothetical protein